jgi:hypothetical protein
MTYLRIEFHVLHPSRPLPNQAKSFQLPDFYSGELPNHSVASSEGFSLRRLHRYILQGLAAADVEKAFREHAGKLNLAAGVGGVRVVALDGKALKGSFDSFNDAKAKQVLSAFAADLTDHIVTCDAIHCQKTYGPPRCKWFLRVRHDRSASTYPASD